MWAETSVRPNLSVDNSTSILATSTNTQFTVFQTKPSRCPQQISKHLPKNKKKKEERKSRRNRVIIRRTITTSSTNAEIS